MKRVVIGFLMAVIWCSVGHAEETKQPEQQQQQENKQKPSPEEIKQQMEATFGMMVPMMGKMVEAMIEGQLTALSKPESAEKIARYVRNLRDALVTQGFSKDEALKIATSLSLPSASMSSK